ncbi:MAG TPA: 6-carboxytetrahydropterin synthase [Tepidisphaeraceae bacterium]|nr:6-carboxytetrahydropterin synthase [Tepidisphaeraceae bacterium]
MFRLTREVRFAINHTPDDQLLGAPSNSYAGFPSLNGFGQFLRLQVTLEGNLDPSSNYLLNIKEIDAQVRSRIVGAGPDPLAVSRSFELLKNAFPATTLREVTLYLSPFLSVSQLASEYPMHTRLSQKFEFSASHRLHNPKLSDEDNRKTYGKCNNPNGHGHNYEVQVTLRGKPNTSGLLVNVPAFEKIVKEHAIDLLDHKSLNDDVPQFYELIPTVENIAMIIYHMLKTRFTALGADLAAVTVWETPKTWCEYSE